MDVIIAGAGIAGLTLALSLHQAFHAEKSSADQLAEIDATLAIIRARNRPTAIAV